MNAPATGSPSTARWRSGRCRPARAHEQHGGVLAQPYCLPLLLVLDLAADGVRQVHLPADHVRPRGRVGVLEVGHEPARARVQRVDDHLAAGRPGDLHAAVLERRRGTGATVQSSGARHEARACARVELGLALARACEQLAAACRRTRRCSAPSRSERALGEHLVVAVATGCGPALLRSRVSLPGATATRPRDRAGQQLERVQHGQRRPRRARVGGDLERAAGVAPPRPPRRPWPAGCAALRSPSSAAGSGLTRL